MQPQNKKDMPRPMLRGSEVDEEEMPEAAKEMNREAGKMEPKQKGGKD